MPLQCNFSVNYNSRGGQCNGGFPANATALASGDYINVSLTMTGLGNQPAPSVTGYFIISAAPTAQGQTLATPFAQSTDSNSPYVCFFEREAVASAANGQATYTFQSPTYNGGAQGSYEMTVVFQTSTGQQYSEDPEFNTGK